MTINEFSIVIFTIIFVLFCELLKRNNKRTEKVLPSINLKEISNNNENK